MGVARVTRRCASRGWRGAARHSVALHSHTSSRARRAHERSWAHRTEVRHSASARRVGWHVSAIYRAGCNDPPLPYVPHLIAPRRCIRFARLSALGPSYSYYVVAYILSPSLLLLSIARRRIDVHSKSELALNIAHPLAQRPLVDLLERAQLAAHDEVLLSGAVGHLAHLPWGCRRRCVWGGGTACPG